MAKTNGKRNRASGNSWERELAEAFRAMGYPDVVTSRSSNRARDAAKIDLVNRDEFKSGRLPYSVQAKNMVGHIQYGKILSEILHEEGIIRVIMQKQTQKVNNRFVTKDKFAILYLEDFLPMIKRLKEYDDAANRGTLVSTVKGGIRTAIHASAKGIPKTGV